MNYTTFFLVVFAVCLADICWTFYFIETENRASVKAAFWSALIMFASAFTTTTYVEDRKYVWAAALGAFIGTWGAVEFKKRKEQKGKN